jgi:hypothetical protein
VFGQLAKQPKVKFGVFATADALDQREHDVGGDDLGFRWHALGRRRDENRPAPESTAALARFLDRSGLVTLPPEVGRGES